MLDEVLQVVPDRHVMRDDVDADLPAVDPHAGHAVAQVFAVRLEPGDLDVKAFHLAQVDLRGDPEALYLRGELLGEGLQGVALTRRKGVEHAERVFVIEGAEETGHRGRRCGRPVRRRERHRGKRATGEYRHGTDRRDDGAATPALLGGRSDVPGLTARRHERRRLRLAREPRARGRRFTEERRARRRHGRRQRGSAEDGVAPFVPRILVRHVGSSSPGCS